MRFFACAVLALWCSAASAEPLPIVNARADYLTATDEVRFRIDFSQPPVSPTFSISIAQHDSLSFHEYASFIYSQGIIDNTIGIHQSDEWGYRPRDEVARVPFTMIGSRFETFVPFELLDVDHHDFLYAVGSYTGGQAHAVINTPEPSAWAMIGGAVGVLWWRKRRA